MAKNNTAKTKDTKETKNSKKGMSAGKMAAVGGAVAGAAALAGGAYYLMGPQGKAHQKKMKDMRLKMEKDAKSKLKMAKDMTQPMYNMAIDTLAATYANQYEEHEAQIKAIAKRLKGEWKMMKGMPAKAQAKATKVVKKAVNTAAKKVVKKTVARA
jgi:hypothetical protein